MTREELESVKVGDKVRCVQLGLICNGKVTGVEEDKSCIRVRVSLNKSVIWGDGVYNRAVATVRKFDNWCIDNINFGWAKIDHEDVSTRNTKSVMASQELI